MNPFNSNVRAPSGQQGYHPAANQQYPPAQPTYSQYVPHQAPQSGQLPPSGPPAPQGALYNTQPQQSAYQTGYAPPIPPTSGYHTGYAPPTAPPTAPPYSAPQGYLQPPAGQAQYHNSAPQYGGTPHYAQQKTSPNYGPPPPATYPSYAPQSQQQPLSYPQAPGLYQPAPAPTPPGHYSHASPPPMYPHTGQQPPQPLTQPPPEHMQAPAATRSPPETSVSEADATARPATISRSRDRWTMLAEIDPKDANNIMRYGEVLVKWLQDKRVRHRAGTLPPGGLHISDVALDFIERKATPVHRDAFIFELEELQKAEHSSRTVNQQAQPSQSADGPSPGSTYAAKITWYTSRGMNPPDYLICGARMKGQDSKASNNNKPTLYRQWDGKMPWLPPAEHKALNDCVKYPPYTKRDSNKILRDAGGRIERRHPEIDPIAFDLRMNKDENQRVCFNVYLSLNACAYPENGECLATHNFTYDQFVWLMKKRRLPIAMVNLMIRNSKINTPQDMRKENREMPEFESIPEGPPPKGTMSEADIALFFSSHNIKKATI